MRNAEPADRHHSEVNRSKSRESIGLFLGGRAEGDSLEGVGELRIYKWPSGCNAWCVQGIETNKKLVTSPWLALLVI